MIFKLVYVTLALEVENFMAAYLTLIDGTIWFPYGNEREYNKVHPHQWQSQMYICKYSGHVSVDPIHKDFGKSKEFPLDLRPYFLAEHSLRLLDVLNRYFDEASITEYKEDFKNEQRLEALIFNCHKVYPPGDKNSPELSEKGQSNFDTNHIRKNRFMIKANSIAVRHSLGLSRSVSPILIDLNRQLQANELYHLQNKTDEELVLMKLPPHSKIFDLKTNKEVHKIYPLNSQELSEMWWSKFIDLGGWKAFDDNAN